MPLGRGRDGLRQRKLGGLVDRLDVGRVQEMVAAQAHQQHDVLVQRGGQDETVIVVGVLADEVDAARRTKELDGTGTVEASKLRQCGAVTVELGGRSGTVHGFQQVRQAGVVAQKHERIVSR